MCAHLKKSGMHLELNESAFGKLRQRCFGDYSIQDDEKDKQDFFNGKTLNKCLLSVSITTVVQLRVECRMVILFFLSMRPDGYNEDDFYSVGNTYTE